MNDPTTFTTEAPDTLELIARMLVGSSYRMPVEGVGSAKGLQPSDISHALGKMRDSNAAKTAVAVATGASDRTIAKLACALYREIGRVVKRARPCPLDLRRPADRMRLRIVTFDAAHELVWPEQREPFRGLAVQAKMRKDRYLQVFRCASSVLNWALAEGRQEFTHRLFDHGPMDAFEE